jgi:outer membrane protein OmpA-like peptidoglycan-associated protein
LFRYGWLLGDEARPILELLARQLAPWVGQAQVDLIGYAADDEQDPNFNLGLIRATLVADVLTGAGLPAEMINIRPAAGRPAPFGNDSFEQRAANRTVVIIVHR